MSFVSDPNRRSGAAAIEECERFFMGEARVHRALANITRRLDDLQISYLVVGGMALAAHGFERVTVDVDILVNAEGLAEIHKALEGLGYVAPFAGSRNLTDVETGVRVEFLVAGNFPGDGKPKPVMFPDPGVAGGTALEGAVGVGAGGGVGVEIDGVRYLALPTLVELKLASGMTNPGRLKDLGDVQELVRVLNLPREFGLRLHEYVRPKFEELWDGVDGDLRSSQE